MEPSPARQRVHPTSRGGGAFWNFLTGLVLLATMFLVGLFLVIFINPYVPFNLFPPPTAPGEGTPPADTSTATPTIFPPTWTPTVSQQAPPTSTPAPDMTSTPAPVEATPTAESTAILETPTITPTLPAMPYSLRGTPVAVSSTIIHPDLACNWNGVGGQAFDMQGAPIVGLTIQLGGSLAGEPVNLLSLTGTAVQYGPAGYEFSLGDKPAASNSTLWVQLLDQAGLPLSAKVYFDTFDDCSKNLVLINFRQAK